MEQTLELRQKRAGLIEQMKGAATAAEDARKAGNETLSAEKSAEFDRIEAQERELSKEIDRRMKLDDAERRAAADHLADLDQKGQAPGGSTEADYRAAFRTWFTKGDDALTADERAILKRGTNDQIVGTNSLGGYTVDSTISTTLIESMKDYSGIAQAATMISTATGGPLYFATLDDTSTLATKVAEAASITIQDLTFGQKQLDAYKYASLMRISWELMQDSAFNIESEMTRQFAPRFGRRLNESCTVGDGSGDPNGVVTATSAGKTAAATNAITYAEIIDLIHSVDPAYRRGESVGFMFNDAILAIIKKLSIGTGDARPLWQPSMREGAPDTIDGYRYWINQDMASSLTANAIAALFGDFSYYYIRMVKSIQIARLNERYADVGLVGYVAHARWDGELLNTSAIKQYKMAAS